MLLNIQCCSFQITTVHMQIVVTQILFTLFLFSRIQFIDSLFLKIKEDVLN